MDIKDADQEDYSDHDSGSLRESYEANVNEVGLVPMDQVDSIKEKLLSEIVNLMHQHSEVSCGNALALNKLMQNNLFVLQEKIMSLLEGIKKRYIHNEAMLKDHVSFKKRNGVGMRGAYLKGSTFFFKGNMFFKDSNCRNCPNTADYTHRRHEGEMFPMDFELTGRHVWSLVDKVGIVQGIKEQVIEYMEARNKNSKLKTRAQKQVSLHTQKLGKLLDTVDSGFEIDWHTISIYNLKHRHTDVSCNAMWNVYLKPSISRASWTNAESIQLYEVVKKHNYEDWQAIADEMNGRSDYQCFVQFYNSTYFMVQKKCIKWTKEEDKRLLQLINTYTMNGVINWNSVSSRFPGRTKLRCVNRYYYSLDPKISRARFTPAEDLTLLAAVGEYGENFSCIPRNLFPNRSVVQLRNRYKITLCNRNKLHPWTVEENQKLMDFVAEHGASSWKKCAETLGNHSRTSCRTRYFTLRKFLDRNPNATVKELPGLKRCPENSITTDNWVEKISEMQNNPDACFIPSKSNKRSSRRKTPLDSSQENDKGSTYASRLRCIDLEIYNFFKYSYNCRLGIDNCSYPLTKYQSLALVKMALDFNMPVGRAFVQDKNLPENIALSCDRMLAEPHVFHGKSVQLGYHMPPNWSTLMGFRVLCVQFADKLSAKSLTSSELLNKGNNDAVQLFRQRLRAIFYTTGLISRLEPQNIENLNLRLKTQIDIMYNLISACRKAATLEISTTSQESVGTQIAKVKSEPIKCPLMRKIIKKVAVQPLVKHGVNADKAENPYESDGTQIVEIKSEPIKCAVKRKIMEKIEVGPLIKNARIFKGKDMVQCDDAKN